jgi:COP9 signalosome complex subunit 5
MENKVESAEMDQIFHFDTKEVQAQVQARPWSKDPHYFKHVKLSAIAMLKMVMHARSGGTFEIMGLLVGRVAGDTMVVTDSFALPVKGTETRVNAGAEADEYMVEYLSTMQRLGRKENACGWYHSHPGYGCWLSGIDLNTQLLYQQFQDPFIAIVVDPTRTISAGKVEIGAFRAYPAGYKPADEGPNMYQTIPLNKIEDFGVHCKSYYSLDITCFKSSLDSRLLHLLWNKYWVSTLSSSPLIANAAYAAGQLGDLADKLEQVEQQVVHGHHSFHDKGPARSGGAGGAKEEGPLAKVARDGAKLSAEQLHGLMGQWVKEVLFNWRD